MIEYREARVTDARVIGSLHAQNFRENNSSEADSPALPTELIKHWRSLLEHPADSQYIQVAFEDEQLLGFICVYAKHDSVLGSLIDNLHVDGNSRTTGIGSSLMTRASNWLAACSKSVPVYLHVLESNQRARKFYERFNATNSETIAMETHGGARVTNCRYTWSNPQAINTGKPD